MTLTSLFSLGEPPPKKLVYYLTNGPKPSEPRENKKQTGAHARLQARHGLCDEAAEVVMAQVKDIYLRLCELDPLRRGFYTDAAAGKAYVVVSAIGSGA